MPAPAALAAPAPAPAKAPEPQKDRNWDLWEYDDINGTMDAVPESGLTAELRTELLGRIDELEKHTREPEPRLRRKLEYLERRSLAAV
jgi:hypothetical protein